MIINVLWSRYAFDGGLGVIMIQVIQDSIDLWNDDKENSVYVSYDKLTIKRIDSKIRNITKIDIDNKCVIVKMLMMILNSYTDIIQLYKYNYVIYTTMTNTAGPVTCWN